jgi:thiosulfate dehydrogenase [quinone] large subunit
MAHAPLTKESAMTTHTRDDLQVSTTESGSWYRNFTVAASAKYWAAIARIMLGFVFLWAFLDKNFGLGYATPSADAWNFGAGDGSPTFGFLTFGANPEGPFVDFFNSLGESAGTMGAEGPVLNPNAWVNWVFMLSLLGIGVAFMLGIFMRLSAIGGAVLLFMMYLAAAPWAKITLEDGTIEAANNPIIDDHIIYGVVMIMLALFEIGRVWGLGKVWESTSIVKSQPWLA